jgi:hypothetical protein
MNTQTGNIFALDGEPLGENEVRLSEKEFAELFPIRNLQDRMHRYQLMQEIDKLKDGAELSPEP